MRVSKYKHKHYDYIFYYSTDKGKGHIGIMLKNKLHTKSFNKTVSIIEQKMGRKVSIIGFDLIKSW